MITLPAPPATQPTAHATPPVTSKAAGIDPALRRLVVGYARMLFVLLAASAALVTGLTLLRVNGWAPTTAAVAGWSLAVAAWLHHRGWPAATAHLAASGAPAALLGPLPALGWLTAAGLMLWGPVSALLSIALAASYDPDLVSRPSRTHRTR